MPHAPDVARFAGRIVGRHAGRPSRFHTARGELMPANAWRAMPALVLKRARARRQPHPWMVWDAVALLDELLTPDTTVLELGSGDSTAWYARRAGSVLSLEDDPGWAVEISARLRAEGLGQATVRHVPSSELHAAVSELAPQSFDVVIIDNDDSDAFTRNEAAVLARTLVRAGGIVVLDDSDHPRWRAANRALSDWPVQRFVGMKPWPLMATETAVFRRQAGD